MGKINYFYLWKQILTDTFTSLSSYPPFVAEEVEKCQDITIINRPWLVFLSHVYVYVYKSSSSSPPRCGGGGMPGQVVQDALGAHFSIRARTHLAFSLRQLKMANLQSLFFCWVHIVPLNFMDHQNWRWSDNLSSNWCQIRSRQACCTDSDTLAYCSRGFSRHFLPRFLSKIFLFLEWKSELKPGPKSAFLRQISIYDKSLDLRLWFGL